MARTYKPTPKPIATIAKVWEGCYRLQVSLVGHPLVVRRTRYSTLHAARKAAQQQYPRATVVVAPDATY